jgi:TP901 family phage tail tape measure protein
MRDVEARLKISAIDRTGKVLSNIGNKLENVNRRAMAFNRVQSAMFDHLGYMARYAAPAALGVELYRATKQAADFETSLFNIQKKSGATSEQMKKLAGDIRGLSNEMPISRDEIAAGMERGAAAGIPIDELKEFTRLTAMIADGWEVSAEESGNFIAGFNKGLHIPIKDMQAFASLINDLADSGIADEKDIADFVDRVGASLLNFGMTPNEVAAYGAAFLNLKMPADVAARAMDTLSGKLLAPENLSKKSKSALTNIVGDLKSFSKLSGNEKMNRFMKSLQKMTGQRRASLLGALLGEGFDDEVMRVVAAYDEVERNMAMAHKQAADPSNSILTMYEKQLETFNKKVAVLKNQLADIELSLGNRLLPLAEKVVGVVSAAAKGQDAYEAGRTKTTGDDPALVRSEAAEFKRRWKEAGLQQIGDPTLELWKARREVGEGKNKDVWAHIEKVIRDKVYNGNTSGGPHRRFPKGYLPKDFLGADPSLHSMDKPPLPTRRPTQAEMDDLKIRAAYAYGSGREKVAGSLNNPAFIARQRAMQARLDDQARAAALDDTLYGEERTMARQRQLMQAGTTDDRRTAMQDAKDQQNPYGGALSDLSKLSTSFEQGGQKIEDSGDEFMKKVQQAAATITQAATQLATTLSNIRIPVAGQSAVNANTGRTNTFVKGPSGMGAK